VNLAIVSESAKRSHALNMDEKDIFREMQTELIFHEKLCLCNLETTLVALLRYEAGRREGQPRGRGEVQPTQQAALLTIHWQP
jgi:hypothetical protein